MAWSPSGPGTPNHNLPLRLATASGDGAVKVWDIERGTCITTFNNHHGVVNRVAFSKDCKYLASGGEDGTVKIYSLNDQKLIKSAPNRDNKELSIKKVYDIAWNSNSENLAAACQAGVLLLDLRYL